MVFCFGVCISWEPPAPCCTHEKKRFSSIKCPYNGDLSMQIYLSTECWFDHRMFKEFRIFHREFTYQHTMLSFPPSSHVLSKIHSFRYKCQTDINVRKLGLQVCGVSLVFLFERVAQHHFHPSTQNRHKTQGSYSFVAGSWRYIQVLWFIGMINSSTLMGLNCDQYMY